MTEIFGQKGLKAGEEKKEKVMKHFHLFSKTLSTVVEELKQSFAKAKAAGVP
jgi:hypothetical protein